MMAVATDAIWGDAAIVHGGWSWRQAYLGWRTWYGPLCYGWTERIKRCIEQHTTLGLVRDGPDQGALGHMLEAPNSVFYNMNEVFTDHLRQYFEYTNDLALMRQVFPVLKGIVEWEGRRLQADKMVPLYESSLDTWISDSHWYIRGQCTTASAYMLGAHRLLAELAEALGEDPGPYRKKAESIRRAMQQTLWQPRQGVFAEYLDTLGERAIAPPAGTGHHLSQRGVRRGQPAPGVRDAPLGRLQPAARIDAGRRKGLLEFELGPQRRPLLHAFDLRVGLWRATEPGLDQLPGRPRGRGLCHSSRGNLRHLQRSHAGRPELPHVRRWPAADEQRVRRRHQHVGASRRRGHVRDPSPTAARHRGTLAPVSQHLVAGVDQDPTVQLSLEARPAADSDRVGIPDRHGRSIAAAVAGEQVDRVTVDGRASSYRVDQGVGLSWLSLKSPAAAHGTIAVSYTAAESAPPQPITGKEGEHLAVKLADPSASHFLDPQGVLRHAHLEHGTLQGTVAGEPGVRLLFLTSGSETCPSWSPLVVRIEPRVPVARRIWSPPAVKAKDLGAWTLVDLSGIFTASLTEVLGHVARASQPPPPPAFGVNHAYWMDHITARVAANNPSDAAWRRKIGPDQIGWTHDGIPFKSPKQGKNIAVVTRAGGFPAKIEVPVRAGGKELYLMLSGMTFPVQSHVVNVRVTLNYSDGGKEQLNLVSPFDIGDCWSTWLWRFHDTAANGFENLGGRFGPPGSAAAGDLTQPIAVDTEAHLVEIPLRRGEDLSGFTVEAVANDVIFGLMGASVLK